MKRFLVITVNVMLLSALAYGDGGFLPPTDHSGKDLEEPCQRAIIVHSGNREKLFLYVDYKGDTKEFAWLIPCPTKPTVTRTDASVFKEAAKYYHHLQMLEWKKRMDKLKADGRSGVGAAPVTAEGIVIHSIQAVGPYEIAVVSAAEPQALMVWLSQNRFAVPKSATAMIESYTREKWFFVAVKIRTGATGIQTLPPLAMDFKTDDPVYPLRISSLNAGVTEIRAYFFHPKSTKPDPNGNALPLRKDFQQLCPKLAKEWPELNWQDMNLARMVDTLAPQAMRGMDDRIHGESFWPFGSPAMTRGIVEALLSSNPTEAEWAQKRLGYYSSLKPRRGNMSAENLAILARVGKRTNPALRHKLLSIIDSHIRAAKQKQQRFNRSSWKSYLMSDGGLKLHGTVILLSRVCAPNDPKVLACLSELTRVAGGGTYWGDTLADLNTPASRRALAKIATDNADLGAAFRLVYSLERNPIDAKEKKLATGELTNLLSKGIAIGGAESRAKKLIKAYSGQEYLPPTR